MEINLLDKMLTAYRTNQTPVTIILQNKSRVSGKVRDFDSYVIVIENQRTEVVYRHAVSSVQPLAAAPAQRARPEQPKAASKPARYPQQHKSKSAQPAPRAAAAVMEHGINTGMKEELLKWMREHKAAK